MLSSTVKQAVLAQAAAAGKVPTASIEIREATELVRIATSCCLRLVVNISLRLRLGTAWLTAGY